ncbi:MAG: 7-cyano-7-deazaguanine synthase QueC [Euryarchaeota archaeon]|nr:7-cyano-7-deazaguanine synthase QueC [Euryarchaeota archaeon]MBV1729680.1 7-cyano-7-deazaguanine synthase QueC [Methanobacterium sp.]MBU4547482.1 7-cyano-7-deazaguanine synthase QueC [Euryarchaeota archaeon]MBU4607513.1 7-cyano-7-deazaguanine synthase QueC [Euryarchaeota archaeon]MBV1754445.1 7-cyano-7-deazaguanine synthase QueC [Methanobacterium sp.]
MNLPKKKAIAVLSGGLDSTVATTCFNKQYEIHALTFDYGQRSSNREIESSKEICNELKIKHTVMDLNWLGKLGKSALTSQDKEIPLLKNEELDDKKICDDTARKVWVPGRNIVFTAIATAFAESEDAEIIIVGWDQEEATTFPDNSWEFLDAFNKVLRIGTLEGVQIAAPLIDLSKKEIVELGHKIAAPMELSYSCYRGAENHCGTCESCMRRKRAFIKSDIEDKTIYK